MKRLNLVIYESIIFQFLLLSYNIDEHIGLAHSRITIVGDWFIVNAGMRRFGNYDAGGEYVGMNLKDFKSFMYGSYKTDNPFTKIIGTDRFLIGAYNPDPSLGYNSSLEIWYSTTLETLHTFSYNTSYRP